MKCFEQFGLTVNKKALFLLEISFFSEINNIAIVRTNWNELCCDYCGASTWIVYFFLLLLSSLTIAVISISLRDPTNIDPWQENLSNLTRTIRDAEVISKRPTVHLALVGDSHIRYLLNVLVERIASPRSYFKMGKVSFKNPIITWIFFFFMISF